MTEWRNWSGLASTRPQEVRTPRDTADVVRAVVDAAGRGTTVKMVGTGHSFTPIAATEGIMLRPEGLTGLVAVDRDAMTVTARSGTRLAVLNAELERLGLTLHNMGDIAEQTLAGATSTGTHGTGGLAASLSAQLSALELVTGDGGVLRVDRRRHPEVFAAARTGLGALGIVTEVTFDVEPLFLLEACERRLGWDELLATYDELLATHHHTDAYWFPHTDRCQVKTNDRLAADLADAAPLPRWRRLLEDDLVENAGLAAVQWLGNRAPRTRPRLNRLAGRLVNQRTYSDVPHRVFTARRRVRFRETEWAVPREAGLAALRELRALVDRRGWRIGFPVEVRHTPADDITLGTSSGRESVYLACHVNAATDHRAYFAGVEEVMVDHGGRPHWGKLHSRDAEQLAAAYPRWSEFGSIRDRLDPHRVFGNAHLRRVLGP